MSESFDASAAAAELFKHYADRVIDNAMRKGKQVKNVVAVRLDRTYRDYVARALARYARGKSFFVRSELVPLSDYFVPLDLGTDKRTLFKPDAADLTSASRCSIITGSGGSGKSMMLRHFLVSSLVAGDHTPVLLELRQLNPSSGTIKEGLVRAIRTLGLDVDSNFLESALEAGSLTLLLDGFDELNHSARAAVGREVQDLGQQYPRTRVILSSRPDKTLEGWDEFTLFRVLPLSLQTATELVAKVPYDASTKTLFVEELRSGLFEKHPTLLSNPLLLSIMLLTYNDAAEIPHKLSTFYSQAYDALFHRHDAWKGGFQRERLTTLDSGEFARAFSAFSLFSYDKRQFVFDRQQALEYVRQARELTSLSFSDEKFLSDGVQAVCLLAEEGLDLVFAHRSFQEYFVARYVQAAPPEVKASLVHRFIPGIRSDGVIPLLFEMDPFIVEQEYVLPGLKDLRRRLRANREVNVSHLLRYLRIKYRDFMFNETGNVARPLTATIRDMAVWDIEHFIYANYLSAQAARISLGGSESDALNEAFFQESGGAPRILTKKLTADGPFLTALSKAPGNWGLRGLQSMLAVQAEVEARLLRSRESLHQLLAAKR